MIIKITTREQGLSQEIMYYGKSKICKKMHLCLHLVANLSFQSGIRSLVTLKYKLKNYAICIYVKIDINGNPII